MCLIDPRTLTKQQCDVAGLVEKPFFSDLVHYCDTPLLL